MEESKYEKIRKNVYEYLKSVAYSEKDRDILSDRIAQEICDEEQEKMKYCTGKQTEAYRKIMGLENNGDKKSYTSVEKELNKTNVRGLVNTATIRLIRGIRKEIIEKEISEGKNNSR